MIVKDWVEDLVADDEVTWKAPVKRQAPTRKQQSTLMLEKAQEEVAAKMATHQKAEADRQALLRAKTLKE